MPFDLKKARERGFPDEDIAASLSRDMGFDLRGAYAKGASAAEVAEFLSGEWVPQIKKPKGYIEQAADWWNRPRTKEEKLENLGTVGEIAGGIVGGVAGGPTPAGIVGAGAGAVAGKNIAELAGEKLLGWKGKKRTGAEELRRQGETMVTNMAGEAVGRAAPVVWRGAKNLAHRVVAAPFARASSEELAKRGAEPAKIAAAKTREDLIKLADMHGIPLNLRQRSGRKWLGPVEAGLHRMPTAVGTMVDSYSKQYEGWKSAMKGLLDQIHVGEVPEEQLVEAARPLLQAAREKFNKEMVDRAAMAAGAIHKEPVTALGAGAALKAGRRANLRAVKDWADKAYGEFNEKYGNLPVRLDGLNQRMEALIAKYPSSELQGLFGGALNDVVAAAKGTASEEATGLVSPTGEALMRQVTLTVNQARKLATAIKEKVRALPPTAAAAKKQAVAELDEAINHSILTALPDDGANALRSINKSYREKMAALKPPKVITDAAEQAGNPAASLLRRAKPEDIPAQVATSPTTHAGTMKAASPETVADIADVSGRTGGIPEFNRWAADKMTGEATIPYATSSGVPTTRISPSLMAEQQANRVKRQFPVTGDVLQDVYSPGNVTEEMRLYGGAVPKAIEGPSKGVSLKLFPDRSPSAASENLGQLYRLGGQANPEVGDMARRSYLDEILRRGQAQSKVFDERFLNPRMVEKTVNQDAMGAFDVAAGPYARPFRDLVGLGKDITTDEIVNASQTAKANEAIQWLKGAAWALPAALTGDVGTFANAAMASTAIPYAAARAFTSPRVASWLTDPIVKPSFELGGAAAGTAGRAIANNLRQKNWWER